MVGAVIALQVIILKLLQPSKALPPIVVTLSGIVTLVKLAQPEKALLPILVQSVPISALTQVFI